MSADAEGRISAIEEYLYSTDNTLVKMSECRENIWENLRIWRIVSSAIIWI